MVELIAVQVTKDRSVDNRSDRLTGCRAARLEHGQRIGVQFQADLHFLDLAWLAPGSGSSAACVGSCASSHSAPATMLSGTSYSPSRPLYGIGWMILALRSMKPYSPTNQGESDCVTQSTTSTTPTIAPSAITCGTVSFFGQGIPSRSMIALAELMLPSSVHLDACTKSWPRYAVNQSRFSTSLKPLHIRYAHGCLIESAFIVDSSFRKENGQPDKLRQVDRQNLVGQPVINRPVKRHLCRVYAFQSDETLCSAAAVSVVRFMLAAHRVNDSVIATCAGSRAIPTNRALAPVQDDTALDSMCDCRLCANKFVIVHGSSLLSEHFYDNIFQPPVSVVEKLMSEPPCTFAAGHLPNPPDGISILITVCDIVTCNLIAPSIFVILRPCHHNNSAIGDRSFAVRGCQFHLAANLPGFANRAIARLIAIRYAPDAVDFLNLSDTGHNALSRRLTNAVVPCNHGSISCVESGDSRGTILLGESCWSECPVNVLHVGFVIQVVAEHGHNPLDKLRTRFALKPMPTRVIQIIAPIFDDLDFAVCAPVISLALIQHSAVQTEFVTQVMDAHLNLEKRHTANCVIRDDFVIESVHLSISCESVFLFAENSIYDNQHNVKGFGENSTLNFCARSTWGEDRRGSILGELVNCPFRPFVIRVIVNALLGITEREKRLVADCAYQPDCNLAFPIIRFACLIDVALRRLDDLHQRIAVGHSDRLETHLDKLFAFAIAEIDAANVLPVQVGRKPLLMSLDLAAVDFDALHARPGDKRIDVILSQYESAHFVSPVGESELDCHQIFDENIIYYNHQTIKGSISQRMVIVGFAQLVIAIATMRHTWSYTHAD